jgi:hypothetical protein
MIVEEGDLAEEKGEFAAGGKILQGRKSRAGKSWAEKYVPKTLGRKSRVRKRWAKNAGPENARLKTQSHTHLVCWVVRNF